MKNRDHDGFFKYIFSVPKNARALLLVLSKHNKTLCKMLAEVDLGTLEEISENYSTVGERGEADVAFKVCAKDGTEIHFGILLEHKSSRSADVLAQTFRYAFHVMVNKDNATFGWYPTKAIIIYNGTEKWDPLGDFRDTPHGNFQGNELPFECEFIDLRHLDNETVLAEENVEVVLGLFAMKYAFDAKTFEEMIYRILPEIKILGDARGTSILGKIKVYLKHYLSREARKMLEETFVSIGQKCGFVSIADEDRAIERELRKEIAEKDQALAEKDQTIADKNQTLADLSKSNADKDRTLANLSKSNAEKDREIMDQARRIAELEAKLAAKG